MYENKFNTPLIEFNEQLNKLRPDDTYDNKTKQKIIILVLQTLNDNLNKDTIKKMENEMKNEMKNQNGGYMNKFGVVIDVFSIMHIVLGLLSSLPDTATHVNPGYEFTFETPLGSVLLGCFLIFLRAQTVQYGFSGGKRNKTKRGGTLRKKRNIRKFRKTNRS